MDRQWALHAAATPLPDSKTYKVYPYLTGVTVTINRDLVSALQITVDAPFEEGIKMLSEDAGGSSPFNTNNLIKVRIGYGEMNLWTPWYYGQLNAGGDGLTIGPEGVSGTVSAQMRNWQSGYVLENESSSAATAKELLQQIADSIGMTLKIEPMALAILDDAATLMKGQTIEALFGKTTLEGLQAICRANGLYCTASYKYDGAPDTLRIASNVDVSKGGTMAGKPRNKYVMRGLFQPNDHQYPILSWGPDPGMASWFGTTARGGNAGVGVRSVNKYTGNPVELDANPYDNPSPLAVGKTPHKNKAQNRSHKGKKLDVETKPGQATPELYSVPTSAKDDGQAKEDMKQQGTAKQTAGMQAQQATLKSLGVPDQDVLELIDVYGLSPRYDGPYEVMEVTHTFAPGSYEMDMKLLRMGTLASDEPEQKGTAGGVVPPSPSYYGT
jgi:hypothetical protein